jgi:hypothetical protein
MFFATMWIPPMTRKTPPATKYFPSRMSWAASSPSGYGSVRTGGRWPGRRRITATMTTAKNAT